MKKLLSSIVAVSIIGVISLSVFGRDTDIKEHFEFRHDMLVGTTLVKKGRYLVRYDVITKQMTVLDGDRLVASVPATMKLYDKSFDSDALLTADTPAGLRLTGLRLGGQREELILSESFALNEN